MPTVWLTYAWDDNKNKDVDYVAQELENIGIKVKLDRWNIKAGLRLWGQIEKFIQNKDECDVWVLYATQNSLGSEACKEELAYALDRALHSRGDIFPIIGLFPSTIDNSLIPAAIRIRLHISLTDTNWKERIKAAAEKREPEITRTSISPYYLHIHRNIDAQGDDCIIEVRPRAGTWSPIVVGIPIAEKDEINFHLAFGPTGQIPRISMNMMSGEGIKGEWKFLRAENEVTPTHSCFIYLNKAPSKLLFGPSNGSVYVIPRDKTDSG